MRRRREPPRDRRGACNGASASGLHTCRFVALHACKEASATWARRIRRSRRRLDPERCALFLDYDGTLVGLAPTPGEAVADDGVARAAGARCRSRLERGRSPSSPAGRSADIDGFLAPAAADRGRTARAGAPEPRRDGDRGRSCRRAAGAGAARRCRLRRRPSRNPGRGQAFEPRLALPAGAGGGGRRPLRWPSACRGQRRGNCDCSGGKWWWSFCRAGSDKGDAIRALLAEPEFARPHARLRRRRRHGRGRVPQRQRAGRDERARRRTGATEARHALPDVGDAAAVAAPGGWTR